MTAGTGLVVGWLVADHLVFACINSGRRMLVTSVVVIAPLAVATSCQQQQ